MKKYLRKLDKFETHHRAMVFSVIFIATIILTRLLVLIHNPNPVFLNIELHHFDYGIFILLISSMLLLIEPKKYNNINLIFTAFASGLIVDEYWLIRKSVVEGTENILQTYNSTIPSVLILSTVTLIVILTINSILKRS